MSVRSIKFKRFLSFLFSLIVIIAIGVAIYFNQDFCKTQIHKVQGMYYVHKGDKAYKNWKLSKAIKMYNKGLKLFPGHYSAWYNLGNLYVAYEDYYSALYAYSQAFKYNPNMMIARMNYGIIATEKLGNFDIAIDQYDKIIKTKRHLLSIPYVYDNTVSSKTNKAIAYYNKGVTYRLKSLYEHDNWEKQRKYLSNAIKAYKKSIKIAPNRFDTWYNLGIAYHISGDYNDAGIAYCKAINLQPMNFEAHYNMAVLLRRLRHYQESYDEIEKASTLVTALDSNSASQAYVAIMMNDIMKSLNEDSEYRKDLKNVVAKEKENIKKHAKNKNEEINENTITLVNGKVSVTKEKDEAILKSFSQCPSLHFFTVDEEN